MFDAATLAKRRQRFVDLLDTNGPLVLVGSGYPIQRPGGLDQTYEFFPYPEYYWLTGSRRWGGAVAYDADEGWTEFMRPVDALERLWEADVESPKGTDIKELEGWLKRRVGRPLAVLGAALPSVQGDDEFTAQAKLHMDAARRVKDQPEVELLQRAAAATAAGYTRAREVIAPGVSERTIQIEMEAAMLRAGADALGYDSIVGVGSHAAVLHSRPSPKTAAADDVVLIDAAGAIAGYTADVTRTFPAGNRFSAEQQAIYDVVLAAELAGIDKCREGVEWHDVHRAAAAELAAGLRHLGILRISVDEALESEAIAMFFPHGIGHMVGLGVRDVGGRAPGREEGRKCCGAKVRVDLPIHEGFVMTIEPGLYFVPAILDDPDRRTQFRSAVAWDNLSRWRKVGGIRIEDDVLVTSAKPKVITAEVPK